MNELPQTENDAEKSATVPDPQRSGSGLSAVPCSPLLEGGAVTELLENMEAWADEMRRQSHPATLTMLRAIRTIEDFQAAGGRADHTRFNAKGPMSEKQPRSRKFSTENPQLSDLAENE